MSKKFTAASVFLGKYASKRKLGKGAFGDVFLVQFQGQELALKVIDKKKMQGENQHLVQYLKGEIEAMKSMDFKYIVELKDFIEDGQYYYMVLEYCNGGDLMNLQAVQPNKVFSLQLATKYLSQVILGLQALHKKGYLHRDIKPQNVLVKNINEQKIFKIADFGFTKKAKNVQGTVLGTQQFMAPQIYKQGLQQNTYDENDEVYGYEVDMWAFGVLFYYMLNLSYPFEINPYWTIDAKYKELRKQAEGFSYKHSVANTRRKTLQNCTDEVEDLFRKIFRIDQQKRINFSQIRQHPVFAKCFPKPSQQSKILYKAKFRSAFLGKGKLQNRLSIKASELSQLSQQNEKLNIPSILLPEIEENQYNKQKTILNLLVEEICFLPQIVGQIQIVEKELGSMQSLMFAFNLTKYQIVLFRNFISNLKIQVFQKKYPGLSWAEYFSTPQFGQSKRSFAKKISLAEIRYSQLYQKCHGQLKQINKLNDSFGKSFDQEVMDTEFNGQFFRSYRKSTDIIYTSLKDYLKTNKVLKFYYFLCMVCICHVFSDLYESQDLKRKIFSPFLEEVTEKSVNQDQISYQKLAHYLRNSSKQVLLKLAKRIIQDVMMMKQS